MYVCLFGRFQYFIVSSCDSVRDVWFTCSFNCLRRRQPILFFYTCTALLFVHCHIVSQSVSQSGGVTIASKSCGCCISYTTKIVDKMIKLPFCPIGMKLPMFRFRFFRLILLLPLLCLACCSCIYLECFLKDYYTNWSTSLLFFFVLLSHIWCCCCCLFADMHEKPAQRLKTDRLLIWIKKI